MIFPLLSGILMISHATNPTVTTPFDGRETWVFAIDAVLFLVPFGNFYLASRPGSGEATGIFVSLLKWAFVGINSLSALVQVALYLPMYLQMIFDL